MNVNPEYVRLALAELEDKISNMRSVLTLCRDYFDSRADIADYSDETGHTPNKEMRILSEIDDALGSRGY